MQKYIFFFTGFSFWNSECDAYNSKLNVFGFGLLSDYWGLREIITGIFKKC